MINNNGNYINRGTGTTSQKRSTTVTAEEASTGKKALTNAEQDTVDIHLASGEEDLSEESDSLLKYGIVAEYKYDENGTTYL